jgi:endonuclease/exonuclease/phosphatase family metal-dependent hydrolase
MPLRIATLNVWATPAPLARDVSFRIDAIGEKLPDYHLDAIAFQEVWTSEARKRLVRAGRRAGLGYAWAGLGRGWAQGTQRGGLLVLSRLPLEGARFAPFSLRGEPERAITNLEYVSGKGFVTLTLQTAEGPVRLVNTHLHSGYHHRTHHYVPHRTAQAIQVAVDAAQSTIPMVAVGDFNFREGDPDYRVLEALLGVRDAAVERGQPQNTTLTSNPYRTGRVDRRKDFVFVRDGASQGLGVEGIKRIFDEPLSFEGRQVAYSNHAGLVVDLSQGGPASASIAQDAAIFRLAAAVLADGKQFAKQRRNGGRAFARVGLGAGAVAGLCSLPRPVSRRRVLRLAFGAAGLAMLAPGVGLSVVSEVFVEDEIRAFVLASRQLEELDRELLS